MDIKRIRYSVMQFWIRTLENFKKNTQMLLNMQFYWLCNKKERPLERYVTCILSNGMH